MTNGARFESRVLHHYEKILDSDWECKERYVCEHRHAWIVQKCTQGPWDLIVTGPRATHLVQCKVWGQRHAHSRPAWNRHFRHACAMGAHPVLATQLRAGGGIALWLMTGTRMPSEDGTRPRLPWSPVTLDSQGAYLGREIKRVTPIRNGTASKGRRQGTA